MYDSEMVRASCSSLNVLACELSAQAQIRTETDPACLRHETKTSCRKSSCCCSMAISAPDSLSKVDTFVDKNDVTSSTTASVSVSAVKNKTKTKKSYHSKKPKDENDQVCFLFSFLVVDVELRVFT